MKDALGHGSNAHNTGVEQIPPKGASELKLFGDNDANLYRQSKQPVEANLDKKIAKGVYDHDLATKLWGYHADRAAQAYNRQMPDRPGQKWHEQFPPAVRQAAAKQWANDFRVDRGGNSGGTGKLVAPIRTHGWADKGMNPNPGLGKDKSFTYKTLRPSERSEGPKGRKK